jgi:hypothetical protein
MTRPAFGLVFAALGGVPIATAEDPATMASPQELAAESPAGVWQGDWRLVRDDPRLRTRAASELLDLQVIHSARESTATLQWTARRAICPDPLDAPCEWIGASGESIAIIDAAGLYAVLPISADPEDPFVLHLRPDGRGLLFSRSGEWRMVLEHRREDR